MKSELSTQQKAISGVFLLPTSKSAAEHELVTHQVLGEKIAALLGSRFMGTYNDENQIPGKPYFIPNDTIIAKEAQQLGIQSTEDFFGGLVTEPFIATKAITHPLIKNAHAPPAWSHTFAKKTPGAVLKGFTAFSLSDTQQAGIQLLVDGRVRIKPVRACAGRGQIVVTSRAELSAAIAAMDENEICNWGVVLEEDLNNVVTFSVGQVTLAGITISYVGRQHLTKDNEGEKVYGGSTLDVIRGDYAQLLALTLTEKERLAIEQARNYEQAAFYCYPGLVASRRNYDIAQGFNDSGDFCSGVLEQSWRIGGASGAEIFALDAFAQDPALSALRASTCEVYGAVELPAYTAVLYRGTDPEVGHITKYVKVESYAYKN